MADNTIFRFTEAPALILAFPAGDYTIQQLRRLKGFFGDPNKGIMAVTPDRLMRMKDGEIICCNGGYLERIAACRECYGRGWIPTKEPRGALFVENYGVLTPCPCQKKDGPSTAPVTINIGELDAIMEYHLKMIEAYGEIPDDTVVATGHTVGYHKKVRRERIKELQRLKDDVWPK
jgi:hypothetical protein